MYSRPLASAIHLGGASLVYLCSNDMPQVDPVVDSKSDQLAQTIESRIDDESRATGICSYIFATTGGELSMLNSEILTLLFIPVTLWQ